MAFPARPLDRAVSSFPAVIIVVPTEGADVRCHGGAVPFFRWRRISGAKPLQTALLFCLQRQRIPSLFSRFFCFAAFGHSGSLATGLNALQGRRSTSASQQLSITRDKPAAGLSPPSRPLSRLFLSLSPSLCVGACIDCSLSGCLSVHLVQRWMPVSHILQDRGCCWRDGVWGVSGGSDRSPSELPAFLLLVSASLS